MTTTPRSASSAASPAWPTSVSDLVPRRSLRHALDVWHMPLPARAAYYGLLAMTGISFLFLMPNLMIYLTTLQSIMQLSGVLAALTGLIAVIFTMMAVSAQAALTLKLPERLEWVRLLISGVVAVSCIEAVLSDWLYPSVLSMGFRWDLLFSAAMIGLLWLPAADRWFTRAGSRT